ncbi:uncharacterized protein LOC128636169 isoform X2 [Bombina bombina]|nr:uncharacterized protein LOC128636169 isoform X2 [Bombina bombina]
MAPSSTDKPPESEDNTQQPEEDKGSSPVSNEKDSGFSDSSSDSLSGEEQTTSTIIKLEEEQQPVPVTYTPVYILQNVVLKQPHLIVLQPTLRCHRKRSSSASYLPILRSYPRIAPRLAPKPTQPAYSSSSTDTSSPTVPIRPPPALIEASLRSIALMHRSRETQRSIRELREHTRLYNQALHGEEGGWERLRRAMDRSGVYRGFLATSNDKKTSAKVETSLSENLKTPAQEIKSLKEEAMTSSEEEDVASSENKQLTEETIPSENNEKPPP